MSGVELEQWLSLVFNLGTFVMATRRAWKSIPCLTFMVLFTLIVIANGVQLIGDLDNLTRLDFYLVGAGIPSLRSIISKGLICLGFALSELISARNRWMIQTGIQEGRIN